MALITNQNLYSLSSQHYLGINQTALGKSIERLSSGLRINHASDDASGMAISEKMRGQIKGLKRASMNAQDGISYLQTAEGYMEQTTEILQRMRELAVQAPNGIYTTNDRAEIQKEVDQLKAEIDRISTSAEFNTRKLINGDGTALWSADTDMIDAIIRGPVPEGNYQIQMSVDPGKNQIMKSDIMTLNSDAIGAEITNTTANTTNIGEVKNPVGMVPTGSADMTVEVKNLSAAITASAMITSTFLQDGSSWVAGPTITVNNASKSGYFEIEALNTQTVSAGATNLEYRYRFIDPMTGEAGAWVTTSTTTANIVIDNANYNIEIPVANGTGKIQAGDKILMSVSQEGPQSAAVTGGGTIKLNGPDGEKGPLLVFTADNSLTLKDNGDTILDTKEVTVHHVTMDPKTGNLNIGSIDLSFKEQAGGVTQSGELSMAIRGGGEAATTSTKLKDIKVFTDGDGNNVFDQKQELTIYGNGKSTVVHIEGNDTIATLVEKLNNAIVKDLGMGSDDPTVNNNLVRYISQPDPTGWGTIKGTFIIQTALTGEQSELSFIGNQPLIDALSLAEIQKPTNNETTVTVRDAHTGNLIGKEVTGDDRIYSIIDGVEVVVDSRAGVQATWDSSKNQVSFNSNDALADKKYHLHLVDNRTSLQIGANKGQDLDVSIPQLDLKGLGLENMNMVSQENARKAIGMLDSAITRVVSARATVGAQVSRLEYTVQNLSTARTNLTNAESRIRDLDTAEESTNFARNQVLVQSGIAMLSQANQLPSMALQLIQG